MTNSENQFCEVCREPLQGAVTECPNCGAVLDVDFNLEVDPALVQPIITTSQRKRQSFLARQARKIIQRRLMHRRLEDDMLHALDFLQHGQYTAALEFFQKTHPAKAGGLQHRVLLLAMRGVRESLQVLAVRDAQSLAPSVHSLGRSKRLFFSTALFSILVLAYFGVWNMIHPKQANRSVPISISVTGTATPLTSETPIPTSTHLPVLRAITNANINKIKELVYWPAGEDIVSLSFSPDGMSLASGDGQEIIKVWSLWQQTKTLEFQGNYAAFSPDGQWIGIAKASGLGLYGASDGRFVRWFSQDRPYYSVLFSPDSKLIVAGSNNNKFYIWSVYSGDEQKPGGGFTSPVHSLSFSKDGHLLAVASNDRTYVWNLQEQKAKREIPYLKQQPVYFSAALDDDGEWYATGQKTGQMNIWRISNGERMADFNDKSRAVYGLQFLHASGKNEILVSGDESSLSFWAMNGYNTSLSSIHLCIHSDSLLSN